MFREALALERRVANLANHSMFLVVDQEICHRRRVAGSVVSSAMVPLRTFFLKVKSGPDHHVRSVV